MKKYIIFIASAVLMMTACAKEEINTATGETEFISVEFAATKTALDADGENTNWTEGDKVRVTVESKNLGTLEYVGDNKFEGEIESVGLDGKLQATINYPADVTTVPATQAAVAGSFADEAALLEGKVTLADLRTGKGGELKNTTALLQFQVAQAGDVTFEVGDAKYTVTGCETGKTYYACVQPTEAVAFKAVFDGYTIKQAANDVAFSAGLVSELGTLPYNVYLHANTSKYNWTSDGARFATWTWGTGVTDSWFDMVAEGHEGVYRLEVPEGYANLIFCRVNGGNTTNDWKNVWNQTADQTIPTDNKNHFYISDATVGAWGDKDYVFPVIKPKDGYLYLKPSSEWLQSNAHFAAWIWKDSGAGKVYNFKKHESVPGIYELNLNGANKMIIFRMDPNKTVTDGSSAWPGDNHWYKSGDLAITGNLYTVVGWQAAGTGFSTITEF